MTDNNERVYLSPEDAEAMLPDGDRIHTFVQAGYALIGADWDKSDILDAFGKYKPELSGEQATAMHHGVVFFDGTKMVFVETKETNDSDDLKDLTVNDGEDGIW